jgi:beta-glucosidase
MAWQAGRFRVDQDADRPARHEDPSNGPVVQDDDRIAFLRDHLLAVQAALEEGCNVKGYMAWSLLDNFEWQMGYKMRFGLVFVAFARDRKRIPKASYDWFRTVAETGNPA